MLEYLFKTYKFRINRAAPLPCPLPCAPTRRPLIGREYSNSPSIGMQPACAYIAMTCGISEKHGASLSSLELTPGQCSGSAALSKTANS